MKDVSGAGAMEAQNVEVQKVREEGSRADSVPESSEPATEPTIPLTPDLDILSGRSLLRRADTREGEDSYSATIWISGVEQAEKSEDNVFPPSRTQGADRDPAQFQLRLPDIRYQADPDGMLHRYIEVYQSFTASPEQMSSLGPVSNALFENDETQPHGVYNIKTVATVKCDLCHQRCCVDSEVYQCRQCTAQICRECVEDKLIKEETQGFTWEWRGPYHLAFKQAYLHRKARGPGTYGRGSWIGSVRVPGSNVATPVELRMPASSKTSPKNQKVSDSTPSSSSASSSASESKSTEKSNDRASNAFALSARSKQDQRIQIQQQTMKFDTRQKLDRIRNAAAQAELGDAPVASRNDNVDAGVASQRNPLRVQPDLVTRSTSPARAFNPATPSSSNSLTDSTIPDSSATTMSDDGSSNADSAEKRFAPLNPSPPDSSEVTMSDDAPLTTDSAEKQSFREQALKATNIITKKQLIQNQTTEPTDTAADKKEPKPTEKGDTAIDWFKRIYDVLPPPWKPSHWSLQQPENTITAAGPVYNAWNTAVGGPAPKIFPLGPQQPPYQPQTQPQPIPPTQLAQYQYQHTPFHQTGLTLPYFNTPTQPQPQPVLSPIPPPFVRPIGPYERTRMASLRKDLNTGRAVIPRQPPGATCRFAGEITTQDDQHRHLAPMLLVARDVRDGRHYQIPVVDTVAVSSNVVVGEVAGKRKRAGEDDGWSDSGGKIAKTE